MYKEYVIENRETQGKRHAIQSPFELILILYIRTDKDLNTSSGSRDETRTGYL